MIHLGQHNSLAFFRWIFVWDHQELFINLNFLKSYNLDIALKITKEEGNIFIFTIFIFEYLETQFRAIVKGIYWHLISYLTPQ